jgi:hypothetical protein
VADNVPAASFLVLDGGIYHAQGLSALNFTRSLGTSGANAFQWTANGGGFSAGSAKLTVNIGGSNQALNRGNNAGTNLVGELKFGHGRRAPFSRFRYRIADYSRNGRTGKPDRGGAWHRDWRVGL